MESLRCDDVRVLSCVGSNQISIKHMRRKTAWTSFQIQQSKGKEIAVVDEYVRDRLRKAVDRIGYVTDVLTKSAKR